jgi:hypothetical protein
VCGAFVGVGMTFLVRLLQSGGAQRLVPSGAPWAAESSGRGTLSMTSVLFFPLLASNSFGFMLMGLF